MIHQLSNKITATVICVQILLLLTWLECKLNETESYSQNKSENLMFHISHDSPQWVGTGCSGSSIDYHITVNLDIVNPGSVGPK